MAKKGTTAKPAKPDVSTSTARGRPSALLDTRVVYCGDCLEQLQSLPDACVDLVYIDPPFNSNRNYEVFWGENQGETRLRGPPRFRSRTIPTP